MLKPWAGKIASSVFLTLLSYGVIGCGIYGATSGSIPVVKSCSIPADQTGTITGRWLAQPIPVALYQGDFNNVEQAALVAAASTWNTFFNSSLSIQPISLGDSSGSVNISSTSNPVIGGGSACGLGILPQNSQQFTGSVIIYKNSNWPSNYPPSAMALTTTCFTRAQPYSSFYMAVIEINYKSFFTSGNRIPDLQSVAAHELGHLIGLNHSCEPTTKAGVPNCTDPGINSDYTAAMMFPSFTFDQSGAGQQRRALGVNDQSRANCLYTGPNGPAPKL